MQFALLTDNGKARPNNEDFCRAQQFDKYTVLVLADGMGGANSGEIASTETADFIFRCLDENFMRNLEAADIPTVLSELVRRTNTEIYNLSRKDDRYEGMGTTLEICIISENTAYIAHIGDSRVYRITSSGDISRITKDHSLVEYMIDAGTISPEEAINHPQKNVITRALGTSPEVEADILSFSFSEGDIILLCSDGLSNMVSEGDIACAALSDGNLSERAEKLVQMANDAGGKDNITVILAQE